MSPPGRRRVEERGHERHRDCSRRADADRQLRRRLQGDAGLAPGRDGDRRGAGAGRAGAGTGRRGDPGQRAPGRAGDEPGPAGGAGGRHPGADAGHDDQPGLRLGAEGGGAGGPGDRRRRGRDRRRRRHGEHVAGAVPVDRGALRLPDGQWRAGRLDARRRADLRHRRLPHGDGDRGHRPRLRRRPGRAGRLRAPEPAAGGGGDRGGPLPAGDRPGRGSRAQGQRHRRPG